MSTSQSPQIFKATYSGVPVYEMQCKNVAVMRRKADSYLNATQILKVAEFDKPQRTRILEREVQKGQHEKIQGGYGKYQGRWSHDWGCTWVPLDRGVSLARQYKVEHLLQPLLDFTAGDTSPPPAPKHVTAAHSKPRKPREPRKRRKKVPVVEAVVSDVDDSSQYSDGAESDGSRHMAVDTVGTRTPSPLARQATSDEDHAYHRRHSMSQNRNSQLLSPSYQRRANRTPQHRQPTKRRKVMETEYTDPEDMEEDDGDEKPSFYAQQLLDYFVSDSADVPEILMNPPEDFDIDVIVDEEGHTSLHWSAAMARIRVVNLLINQGADIFRVNYRGQTALMRAVLFTNNFDTKTFGTLLDLLQKTIFNIDKNDQTVFHHIASTAGWRGKVHASRYYMECLIAKLSSNRRELIAVLDVQDVYGDTALTIAARIANKKLVKLLLDAGASSDIVNEEGKTAQDYITDADRRYRFDGDNGSRLLSSATSDVEQGTARNLKRNVAAVLGQAINQTKVVPAVTKLFDELSTSYEKDILDKEQDIREAKLMQRSLKRELIEVRSKLHNISSKADLLKDAESKVETLQSELFNLIEQNQKHKLLDLLNQEQLKPPTPEQNDVQENATMVNEQKLEQEVEEMERELAELQTKRISLVKDISHHRARPANERHQDYKRLIALCCGVEYDSVDLLLNPLLEALDAEESPRSSL
ncbi:Transcription factor mbp1 [Umbelopsis sp. WA50703]